MATSTTTYRCDYCSFTAKSKTGITRHEAACKNNTTRKALLDAEIETIRQTATSLPHLFKLLDTFWRSQGLLVTLNQYPDTWSDLVSNSHDAPSGYRRNWSGDPALPKGYPGWKGKWAGTVTALPNYKGSKKDPGSCEAFGSSFSKDNIRILFIKTGTGGGGTKFQYDGKLFLYDFPLMHEQWKSEKGEYHLLSAQYTANIKELTKEFALAKSNWVAQQPDMIAIRELNSTISRLLNESSIASSAVTTHYYNEFTANNPIDIPEVPSAFIDNKAYENLVNLNLFTSADKPEISELFERTAKLAEELSVYPIKYPEYFI